MKTILLVDDEKLILDILEHKLNNIIKNVIILKALTYKEAIKYILDTNNTIDAAILDLNLPDVEVGAIVDFASKKHIPSVVLTGMINDDLKKTILKNDIIDYFLKDGRQGIEQAVQSVKRVLKNYNTNILVVDDSPMQLAIIVDILKKYKFNITTAKNGKKALDIIERNDKFYSLILTDYNMPIMDGMELTFKIREKYNKDKLSIIVLSANNTPDISSTFIKMGANDFIHKPISEIEVITRLNSNLELLDLFEETYNLANKDFLTGAYNRRYFFDSAKTIFAKAKRRRNNIAVAMLDIDKFKNINDTYGHDVGDEVIKNMVNVLDFNLRKSDLMSRFGGEEFCVLLEDISLKDTQLYFEKIRVELEKNIINIDDKEINYSVSIGVCYGLSDTLESMIKISDEALYFCKKNGRNQISINVSH